MTLSYASIEDLFLRYRNELLRRMVAMVRSRETAADLVQEAYLKLVRTAPTTNIDQPRALLHRIATNLAIDHLRAHKAGPCAAESLDTALDLPSATPSPEQTLLGKERLHRYMRTIDTLPPRTRKAFLLFRALRLFLP
ncbi:MAG: RNA polymerase sigma factor [Nitrospira sp.]